MLGEGPARLPPAARLPGLSAYLGRERPVRCRWYPCAKQTLQVEEQEQAQLPLDQTSWNKFASDSLLTGCAASAAGRLGDLMV